MGFGARSYELALDALLPLARQANNARKRP